MNQAYHSHYRPEDDTYQTNQEHEKNVAHLAKKYCRIPLLQKSAWLTGLHHDDGKYVQVWQKYFEDSIHNERKSGKGKEDHSTLGGLIVDKYEPKSRFSEMIQIAIYMHHGLGDCVSLSDGSVMLQRRKEKYSDEIIEEVQRIVEDQFPEIDMAAYCRDAKKDLNQLVIRLKNLSKDEEGINRYGNVGFYLGLCERMLFSCLMDADWRDTADFMSRRDTITGLEMEEIQNVWEVGIQNLEARIARFARDKKIDICRNQIADQCRDAALKSDNLYRLAVPTGAGKTLSSLRFALYCAKEHHKRHIFYIAPFKSILEQNAEEIRKTLGMPEMILEHHSDVVQDDEYAVTYARLIENWDEVPVIVTTAVQFLNTLFKEKRSNIRRFHSLCDSVIIVDEVQSLPVKIVEMFNMAVNFLTQVCNSTVVLCTATQPLFEEIRENRMRKSVRMTEELAVFEKAFRRVEYHDCVSDHSLGFSITQAAEFVVEKLEQFDQILLILNTKECAQKVYERLKGEVEGHLFHLSTRMCAQHRSDVLKEIKEALATEEKVICVSTQLVEAGVDFSFQCVIRSLAGLDNLIQAAGRCNRNGLPQMGQVFLIEMSEEAEKISSLPDIKKAQEAMRRLLYQYHKKPEEFGGRLDSEKAIQLYYQYYFYNRDREMAYNVTVEGVKTNLVELLSFNKEFAGKFKNINLKQAFQSAGEAFNVIEEKGGADIVTLYGDAEALLEMLQKETDFNKKRKIIQRLQRYSVHLSDVWMQKLGHAIYGIEENTVLILEKRYYDENSGVQEEPGDMPFLTI